MRYFVVADDGNKYGPADLPTLNQWAQEGRVLQTHMLEEETTGRRVAATSVPGLNWTAGGPSPFESAQGAPGQPFQGYYQRPGYSNTSNDKLLKEAWWCAVLSLICCGLVFGAVGLRKSLQLKDMGDSRYQGPMIVSIIGLALSLIGGIARISMLLHR